MLQLLEQLQETKSTAMGDVSPCYLVMPINIKKYGWQHQDNKTVTHKQSVPTLVIWGHCFKSNMSHTLFTKYKKLKIIHLR
jgi:hypothetical protein